MQLLNQSGLNPFLLHWQMAIVSCISILSSIAVQAKRLDIFNGIAAILATLTDPVLKNLYEIRL